MKELILFVLIYVATLLMIKIYILIKTPYTGTIIKKNIIDDEYVITIQDDGWYNVFKVSEELYNSAKVGDEYDHFFQEITGVHND